MSEPIIDAWECPVCYLPLSEVSGTVRPSCRHEICLPCYCQLRDRSNDPICVLCRATYCRRPTPLPQAHNFYDEPAGYAYEPPHYEPLTEEQVSQMMAEQLVPFIEVSAAYGLRPIVAPSVMYPGRAETRRQSRLIRRPKLSAFSYKDLFNLLAAPAVYEGTVTIVPPAAMSNTSHRLRQARILGLQRASESERTKKADKQAAREATKGSISCNYESRTATVKVFHTVKPPMKKFRIGDCHQPSDGPMGKCVGHHLWLYDDGTYIRKGIKLPSRSPATISV